MLLCPLLLALLKKEKDFKTLLSLSITSIMASYLITGASRGFGFWHLSANLLFSLPQKSPKNLCNCTRRCPRVGGARQEVARSNHCCSTRCHQRRVSIKQAAAEIDGNLAGKGLDVLMNSAGVCQYAADGVQSMCAFLSPTVSEKIDRANGLRDNLAESFTVNILGVHSVHSSLSPASTKGPPSKKVANM